MTPRGPGKSTTRSTGPGTSQFTKNYDTIILAKAENMKEDYKEVVLNSKQETIKATNDTRDIKGTWKVDNRVSWTKNITKDYNNVILAKAENVVGDYNKDVLNPNHEKIKATNITRIIKNNRKTMEVNTGGKKEKTQNKIIPA